MWCVTSETKKPRFGRIEASGSKVSKLMEALLTVQIGAFLRRIPNVHVSGGDNPKGHSTIRFNVSESLTLTARFGASLHTFYILVGFEPVAKHLYRDAQYLMRYKGIL